MKAIELSRLAGASVHTVRYYERLGLLRARRNRRNGYHEFGEDHVEVLAFIRRARALGLTLPEVRDVMGCAGTRTRCPEVLELVLRVLPRVEREIAELATVRERLRNSLRRWRRLPGGTPKGADVRRLLQSLAANASRPKAARSSGGGPRA